MTATEMNIRKMELIRMLLDVDDEGVLNDIASRIVVAPCRFTADQLRKRIEKADKEIAAGRFIAHENIERKAI